LNVAAGITQGAHDVDQRHRDGTKDHAHSEEDEGSGELAERLAGAEVGSDAGRGEGVTEVGAADDAEDQADDDGHAAHAEHWPSHGLGHGLREIVALVGNGVFEFGGHCCPPWS